MNRRTSSCLTTVQPDRRRRTRWRDLWLVGLAAAPLPALAQLALTTEANTQYEYNSNVFDLQHGYTVPGVSTPPYGDSFVAYGGKLDATYLWSQQQVRATVSGTKFHYDHFGLLNHSNYTLDGAWKWKLEQTLDGLFGVTRAHTMVPLYNLTRAQLVLQTQQRETGKLGIRLSPYWRAEVSGYSEHDQVPLGNVPHLSLTETSGQGAIKYIGPAGVTTGLSAGYLRGNFSGTDAATAPAYHQNDVALTMSYTSADVSSFAGRAGYSRRASAAGGVGGNNNISGATWDLDYKHALTGKTTSELELSRLISPYVTNTGSTITTIAAVKLNWQVTYKIDLALEYDFTYQQLPGQGGVSGGQLNGNNRVDRFNFVSLAVDYEALTWLALKPYARFQKRTSKNFAGGDFDTSVVGVQFSLLWQHGTPPVLTPFEVQPR